MKNTTTNLIAIILMLLMFGLAFFSMLGDSLTMDELAHTPAGYSYVTQQDMRLNPEHPPLLKDMAGFSVWLGSKITNTPISFPSQSQAWQEDINGQWQFGRDFLFNSANETDQIIFWSRLPMLLVMLLLGFFVFKWTRQLYGNRASLFALFLYSLSPTFIAHGRLVTTDVGAAAAFFIATYYLLKWLKKPNYKNLIIAGIVFGLALLTKFSLAILIPYFVLITIIWATFHATQPKTYTIKNKVLIQERPPVNPGQNLLKKIFSNNFKYLAGLLMIGLIGLILIWPVYFLHTYNYPAEKQLQDTEEFLSTFGSRWLADPIIQMADYSMLRPFSYYFTGLLMVMQRADGGNTTFFLGETNNVAWPEYFPVVFAIKVPLVLLILSCLALIYAANKIKRPLCYQPLIRINQWIRKNFTEFSLLLFFVIYWFLSITSNLNIGVRHVLPIFPILYILIGGQITQWLKINFGPKLEKIKINSQGVIKSIRLITSDYLKATLKYLLIISLLAWYGWSVIGSYPHFLTYFNELVGGAENGHHYVTDSNLDWGQDLKRLTKFVEQRGIQTIYIDYFGGDLPEYRLREKFRPWWGNRNPNELPSDSWLAISATFLQGGRSTSGPGFDQPTRFYEWLNQYEPVAVIGHSIFVYRIP